MMLGGPILARLKLAAISAVDVVGGIAGAAKTTGRSKATAGRWHNLNDPDLPTLESALAMDMASVSQGGRAHQTESMAEELGFALLRLPDAEAGAGDWFARIGELSREAGDAVKSCCDALAGDNRIDRREAPAIRKDIRDVIRAAVEMDSLLAAIGRGES